MKIAIDCRYLSMSGIGVYLKGILENLDYQENEYILIGDPDKLAFVSQKAKIIVNLTNPFSFKGLLAFKKEVNKCSLFLAPHFIVPFGIKVPIFTIIYDLITLDIKSLNKGFIDSCIKKFLIKRALQKSQKVFTISNFTKSRINYHFKKTPEIIIAYPSVSQTLITNRDLLIKDIQKENKIVFVGNIKKHKGINTLIDAYEMLPKGLYDLYIVGNAQNFRENNKVLTDRLEKSNVIFTNKISDLELYKLIASSKYLVQPSIYEGFGIPPLEAFYLKTSAIISDIPVFKEIYGGIINKVFKVNDANDLKAKLLEEPEEIFDLSKVSQYDYQVSAQIIVDNFKIK